MFEESFMDNPFGWITVFVVLVLSYIPAIKLFGKVSYAIDRERKADKARNLGHLIEGKLVKQWVSCDDNESSRVREYWTHATYEYSTDGKTKKYKALFKNTSTAPIVLHMYYIKDPRRVFAVSDYHWENYKGLILFPIMISPWLIAVLTLFVIGIKVD